MYSNPLVKKELIKESEAVFFHSNFNFLKAHNGWRPGKLHLVMAPSSAGKSTLVRTLLVDLLSSGKKVVVYLSEESHQDFWTEMAFSGYEGDGLKNLFTMSEMDTDNNSTNSTFKRMADFIDEKKPDIFFTDNLTTMDCYNSSIQEQSKIAKIFKKLAERKNLPLIVVAHTGAQIKESYGAIIDMNDIRGSKQIVNEAEFLYILQPIFEGDKRHTFLSIKKHRGQIVKNTLYQLFFFESVRLFAKDEKVSFELFKEHFKNRNKL